MHDAAVAVGATGDAVRGRMVHVGGIENGTGEDAQVVASV